MAENTQTGEDQLQPVDFDLANTTFSREDCSDVRAFVGDGQAITCWELTDEQLEVITRTRRLYLGIVASGAMVPVWLCVGFPFVEETVWPEVLPDDGEVQD